MITLFYENDIGAIECSLVIQCDYLCDTNDDDDNTFSKARSALRRCSSSIIAM